MSVVGTADCQQTTSHSPLKFVEFLAPTGLVHNVIPKPQCLAQKGTYHRVKACHFWWNNFFCQNLSHFQRLSSFYLKSKRGQTPPYKSPVQAEETPSNLKATPDLRLNKAGLLALVQTLPMAQSSPDNTQCTSTATAYEMRNDHLDEQQTAQQPLPPL